MLSGLRTRGLGRTVCGTGYRPPLDDVFLDASADGTATSTWRRLLWVVLALDTMVLVLPLVLMLCRRITGVIRRATTKVFEHVVRCQPRSTVAPLLDGA